AVSGNLLDGATDANGDALSVSATSVAEVGVATEVTLDSGKTGTLTVNADGSYTFVPSADFIAMAQGETEQLTFTYTIADGNGGFDTATVTIDIEGINEAPDVIDQFLSTDEDSATSGNILDGATDPNGDPVTVTSTSIAALGEATEVTFDSGKTGTLTVNADGTFTFVPSDDFQTLGNRQSETLTFTYVGEDGLGGSDEATALITVFGLNDAPIVEDQLSIGNEDSAEITGNALDGAFDIEGDALTVQSTSLGAVGEAIEVTLDSGKTGTLTVNADGSYSFVPSADFQTMNVGDEESFSFTATVSDGNGGTDVGEITVVIEGRNDAPVALDDAVALDQDAAGDGASVIGNVLPNDSDIDVGAMLSVSSVSGNAPGDVLPISAVGTDGKTYNGTVSIAADGSVTFDQLDTVPMAQGESVVFSVAYTLTDEHGATDTAVLNVTVNGVNDAPVAVNDAVSLDQDASDAGAATVGNVLPNDSDADNGAVLSVLDAGGLPVGEAIAVSATGTDGETYNGTVTIAADGSVTFDQLDTTPMAQGESAIFSVDYTLTDEFGATDTATLAITVNGVNDAPVAEDDPIVISQDSAEVGAVEIGNVLPNDTDVDNGAVLTVASAAGEAPGTEIPVSATGTDGQTYNGTVVIAADGSVTLDQADTVPLAAGQSVVFSVEYTVTDEFGATDTATVDITVNGLNDAPDANPDVFVVDQDSPDAGAAVVGNVLPNDTDPDFGDTLDVVSVATRQNPGDSIPVTGTGTNGLTYTGTVVIGEDGTVTLDQADTQSLAQGDSVTFTVDYRAEDQGGLSDSSTVSIVVNGVNDAPVAEGELYELTEDSILTSNLLTNDTDPDDGAVLSIDGIPASQVYSVTTAGGREAQVTVTADGNVSFIPGENFQDLNDGESDTFDLTYTVTDEFGATDEATATFVVNGSDDAVAVPAANQVNLVFVIDNSISMFAENTAAEDTQDMLGNNDGVGNAVDLAISYANNVSAQVAIKQVFDQLGYTAEDTTAVVSKIIGFGDTAVDFGEYAAMSPELASATFGMDNALGGSNFTVGLEAAEAWILETAPVEETVIYFISEGESTSNDFMDVKYRLEAMGNVEIEAVAVNTGISAGVTTDDLEALDTEGDIDVMTNSIDIVLGSQDAAGEFDFT
ncbi:MAG: Ig-like domain-containing protein, partial [Pseudomonadota bacterium]